MSQDGDNRRLNRRTVLKGLGTTTTLPMMGVVTADGGNGQSDRELIHQSHDVLENTGSVEKQHQFLRNHGVQTVHQSNNTSSEESSNFTPSAAGTQSMDMDDISLSFSLFSVCDGRENTGTFAAELAWEYDDDVPELERPEDYIGITWRDGAWDYDEGNKYEDLYVSDSDLINFKSGSHSQGPIWTVDDTVSTIIDQDYYWAGVYMNWTGEEIFEKTLTASYTHTFQNATITGMSVSFPAGVSVSVGSEDNKWKKASEDNGDFLDLARSNASSCS